MPAGGTGPETFDEIDASGGGVSRVAHPDEAMQRTGDAIAGDGDVRPVDPVDIDRLDDRLAEIGAVRGVFVPYNYHRRDADAIAARHGVPALLPAGMTAPTDEDVAASVERFEGQLDDTGYYLRPVTDARLRQHRSTARRRSSPSRLARPTTSSRPANG